ncbi:Programmed cell death antitoxin PemI [Lutibaculum baratangense AMV1]|uniref:Programmed cell death antitoxin PemI n=1 Tax=Lutibaculum baratangense AMV1 TaxID=631454 RepID=V4TGS6_9HYPH|nr:Programmed cell death antitoxin PemI [Lutibaculum baratangense AMV1]
MGGSIMLAIPPATLEELGLSAGSTVSMEVENGKLAVAPSRRRYNLDELLAQCDPDAPVTAEDRAWLEDEPVDREEI